MKYIISLILISFFWMLVPAFGQDGPPALVRTVPVEQRMVTGTADMTGTLYFDRTSRVSPEEAAQITAVKFKEGQLVKKGDVLVRLDTQILEKELALQKARLAQVGIRIEKTRLNLDRQTRLLKKKATPVSVYDEQRFSLAELLQEQIALSRQVDILAIRLSKHVVKAPFDGIILQKKAAIGEWVVPGSALCVLGAADAIYVQVPVAEHLVRFVKIGDSLPVFLHASQQELLGIMQGIRPMADPKTKNISLKLKIEYEGPIAENMSAKVLVPVAQKKSMLMIPRDALVQVRGQDTVYIIEAGKAVPQPVTLIHSDGVHIGVDAPGLSPGMDVVTEGNERLRPGQAVTVQAGEKP